MPSCLLEFHVHLSNGSVHRFAQHNPQQMEVFLDKLRGRIFNQPALTFFNAN